jgi:hypothetical protein
MQAAFGSPPQHVVGFDRPFLRDQIIDFCGIQRVPEVRPQIGWPAGIAKDAWCARAMTVSHRGKQVRRKPA